MNTNVESSEMYRKHRLVVAQDYLGWSPLHRAVKDNRKGTVLALLSHSDTDVNARTPEGYTGLYLVCDSQNPDLDVARDLLQRGADPNIPDKNEVGPLHLACNHDNVELAQLLILHRANVNGQDCDDCSPLHYAIGSYLTEVIKYLPDTNLTETLGFSVLYPACRHNSLELVQLLIRHYANVNSPDRQGRKPLHCAIESDSRNLVHYLLDNGADANLTQTQGLNALMLTLQSQSDDYILASMTDEPITSEEYELFALIWQHTDIGRLSENQDFVRFVCEQCPLPFCYKHYELILNVPGINSQVDGASGLFCNVFANLLLTTAALDGTKSQHLSVIGWLLDRNAQLLTMDVAKILRYFWQCAYKQEVWKLIFSKTTPDITEPIVQEAVALGNYDLVLLFITYCVHLYPENVLDALQDSGETFLRKWFAFFTPSSKYIRKITDRQFSNLRCPSKEFVSGMVQVKSLLELSRDTVREAMQDSCNTSQDFLVALEGLKIPLALKNVIRLGIPVNKYLLED